jgi:hypothetical protein
MDMFSWIVEIVLRLLEKKGFVLLPSVYNCPGGGGLCVIALLEMDKVEMTSHLLSKYKHMASRRCDRL